MKSGFVNIIGNPNVGKSTLMNRLVGERISIITSKAQTTRHRIMGIVNGASGDGGLGSEHGDFQIVYSDTPGILRPGYKLQESMMRFVKGAVQDADVILYVTDTVEGAAVGGGPMERSAEVVENIKASGIPTIVIINKIDLSTPEAVGAMVERWQALLPDAQVTASSALLGFNTEGLLSRVLELLPEGDPYYDRDALTDRSLRFFASEIIREKILLNYSKEVPYSVEVAIEEYREEATIDRIRAVIYVSRASQKGIVIGHKGEKLKKVGTAARHDLEEFLGKKVFLELFVKVADGWRDNDSALRRFGYEE
ncbi:MAG: GTPase Era [Alistipes sp.]|jgi:GTP-binding protein Era|nr:GTPase Era [Alistipes sp.]